MPIQSVSDLQNTLSEMQSILNNTIEPLFTDLELISSIYEPLTTAQNTLIQKCDEVIAFLNSGSNGTGTNGLSAYELAILDGYIGDLQTWLLSLKGQDGTNGANGQDGQNGTSGQNGLSAYELALQNGFTGTQSEWLLSLKGASTDFTHILSYSTPISSNSSVFIPLPDFDFQTEPNSVYEVKCFFRYSTPASTTGIKFGIRTPPNALFYGEIEVPILTTQASTALRNFFPTTASGSGDCTVTGSGTTASQVNVCQYSGFIRTQGDGGVCSTIFTTEVNRFTVSHAGASMFFYRKVS